MKDNKKKQYNTAQKKRYKVVLFLLLCLIIIGCAIGLFMFGKNKQSEESQNNLTITVMVNNCLWEMVYVQGGTFTMGGASEKGSDANPAHSVTINSFYIGKYTVDQEMWKRVMNNNPSDIKGDQLPVEMVSWNDVQQFIEKLNEMTGKRFRLPTEAEWEYAARGGNKSKGYKYSGSNTINDVAWYDGNSGWITHPVGIKLPNELGIYDMSGNVHEWCSDWYDLSYYSSSPSYNPKGPDFGSGPEFTSCRVMRGGSWHDGAEYCRVSARSYYEPDHYYSDIGFRLVLVP
ncbi:MAG: formylglycine-generating enzyme family protein [Bacteroidales bacterium]|jgi:formylglycine-generating enzyme required for sulfatase activity|nr:formylglycine-generating enzyme family protein [Bacteroidales bacterium]